MAEQTNEHPHPLAVLSPTTASIVDILYKRMHSRMIYVYVNGACQQKKGAVVRTGYGHNDDMALTLVRSYTI